MTTRHGTASPAGLAPAGARLAAPIPAITVRPPWSWAIAHGPKRIENRSWSRSYRGPLAIHAGKSWDRGGLGSELVQRAWRDAGLDIYALLDRTTRRLTTGAVVAVVNLVDICTTQGARTACDCGPWAVPGQCHWRLANVRPLAEPVPCRGAQSLWPLPPDVAAAVRAQLPTVRSR